jgi:hypothetical protein
MEREEHQALERDLGAVQQLLSKEENAAKHARRTTEDSQPSRHAGSGGSSTLSAGSSRSEFANYQAHPSDWRDRGRPLSTAQHAHRLADPQRNATADPSSKSEAARARALRRKRLRRTLPPDVVWTAALVEELPGLADQLLQEVPAEARARIDHYAVQNLLITLAIQRARFRNVPRDKQADELMRLARALMHVDRLDVETRGRHYPVIRRADQEVVQRYDCFLDREEERVKRSYLVAHHEWTPLQIQK